MELLSFNDIFSPDLLSKVYSTFEKHINQETISTPFPDTVKSEVLVGTDWENLLKILTNHNALMDKDEASKFLEFNCYNVWFAKKQLEGHEFTDLEKSALAGFAFYYDNAAEEDTIDKFVTEQRGFASKEFISSVFNTNITGYVKEYQEFLNAEKARVN